MKARKSYAKEEIAGKKFGRLTAIKKVSGSKWLFICDCGKSIELTVSRVYYGQLSCGCMREESKQTFKRKLFKHGQSKTKLYRKYRSMINRCYDKNNKNYKRYGGRGITVCKEWLESFESFLLWAYANGYDPNLDGRTQQSIDRIDNSKGYSPDNCRWATQYEQQRNRDCTSLHEYQGELYTASEFSDKFGISDKSFVYRRIERGQSLEHILTDWKKIHDVPSNLIEVSNYANEHGISKAHVRRLINQGKIKGEKVGRKWYIRKEDAENEPENLSRSERHAVRGTGRNHAQR